jgi:beta-1,4-mannosyl-glycoprotein beta-1,4-N-acetylglucosaminyltransferase
MKHCNGVEFPLRMQAQLRYYSFDRVYMNGMWAQPVAIMYGDTMNIAADDIRKRDNLAFYPNSSWTCSYCFDSVALMHTKIGSISGGAVYDVEANRDVSTIIRRVRMGVDIYGRKDEVVVLRNDTNVDIPEYVTKNPSCFHYLLNRDRIDAGFRDAHSFTR